jgi:hypothetical protein
LKGLCLLGTGTPLDRKNRFLLMRSEGGYFAARSAAGIDEAGFLQSAPGLEIKMPPLALKHRIATPLQPHPAQILNGRAGKLRRTTLRIEILHTEKKASTGITGSLAGHRKGERMAEMQVSRGGGSETACVNHGSGIFLEYQVGSAKKSDPDY